MRTRHGLRVLAVALTAGLAVAGCTSPSQNTSAKAPDPVRPEAVKLGAHPVPANTHIGIVVSLKSAPGQGSEWLGNAGGAEVAAYQYKLGGRAVTLDVVDDKGTAAGATAALRTLAGKEVAGIVAATSGSHLTDALAKAATRTPVLLPYETDAAGLPDNVWLTGPDSGQVVKTLRTVLAQRNLRRPFVVTTDQQPLPGLDGAQSGTLGPQSGGDALRAGIEKAARSGLVDSVVVAAPAEAQASLVAALQGTKLDLPVLLGADAVSPVFADSLAQHGSLAGELTTVGLDAGDVTALGSDDHADRAASFFAALRIVAGDPQVQDLFGQATFADQAGVADIRSHDAVVSLVRAVATAGSTAPDKVLAALSGLRVTGSDGLAGPDLDFRLHSAVADQDVHVLHATSQNPSVRPSAVGSPLKLFWFAEPSHEES
ncbi:ABC transporter substrate-binding protein [Oryzihumus leptocrescens]|uniref:ABC-type branched-subunit amino acid transport system substrate-binding protein n=1 Tax=Oryzihumus leptocrescens TaxID=297536 RepID=A0A542ZGV0_9MICO|nr:ABC transporter substrate-binding protein [Oryzihumus leptocrescens]TQL59573.1 ABC-type branched-subunit amino acid transport system substrate-binding protein [Oryzihumus leptocrescens]